jgi:hypothetical protein
MRRALVLALALLLPACDHQLDAELLAADSVASPDLSGSVRIPLSTSASDGTTYLLRDATVEISGAAMMTLGASTLTQQPGGEPDALTAPLPAGSYTLYLRPGFSLVEVDARGVERPVEAKLHGDNPKHFVLRELQDSTLKLAFVHAGRPVVFGAPHAVRLTRAY